MTFNLTVERRVEGKQSVSVSTSSQVTATDEAVQRIEDFAATGSFAHDSHTPAADASAATTTH